MLSRSPVKDDQVGETLPCTKKAANGIQSTYYTACMISEQATRLSPRAPDPLDPRPSLPCCVSLEGTADEHHYMVSKGTELRALSWTVRVGVRISISPPLTVRTIHSSNSRRTRHATVDLDTVSLLFIYAYLPTSRTPPGLAPSSHRSAKLRSVTGNLSRKRCLMGASRGRQGVWVGTY